MSSKHSPTPWTASTIEQITAADQRIIGDLFSFGHTDAAHIVKCVNSHDDLVAALKEAHRALWDEQVESATGLPHLDDVVEKIEKALADVGEKVQK